MWVRVPPSPMTAVIEFLRESRRIDQLIWDTMALVADERVLFCGFANSEPWVRRAVEIGVDVTVIESDEARISDLTQLGIKFLRGSTTLIPARDSSFDAVVAYHYLHEIDPTFHAQTVFDLARVGGRLVVVELAPPHDRLGRRISELYSRAKFEAGAFEEYQPIEYWRKLLAIVKADVVMERFTFTRIAPRFLVEETVDLLLDAMTAGELPKEYVDELRALARTDDSILSPPSRYVLVGMPGGEEPRRSAGTLFRPDVEPASTPAGAAAAAAAVAGAAGAAARAGTGAAAGAPYQPTSEFPPVLGPGGQQVGQPTAPPGFTPTPAAPGGTAPAPQPFVPPQVGSPAAADPPLAPFGGAPAAPAQPGPGGATPPATPAFGMPPPQTPFGVPDAGPSAPFGTPFALPDDPDPFGLEADPARRPGFGWSWEPPEGQEDDFEL